jgi:hypothetical protein
METISKVERRRYPRYIVSGDVQLFREGFLGNARLVQFGLGGMLLRGGQVLPVGKRVTAKIQAADYPYEVEVPAEVVGVRNALMAVKFLGSAGPVLDLGRWLAARNQPVAPLPDSSELVTRLKQMRCSTSIPRWSTPRDREAALEFAYAKTQVGTSHGR